MVLFYYLFQVKWCANNIHFCWNRQLLKRQKLNKKISEESPIFPIFLIFLSIYQKNCERHLATQIEGNSRYRIHNIRNVEGTSQKVEYWPKFLKNLNRVRIHSFKIYPHRSKRLLPTYYLKISAKQQQCCEDYSLNPSLFEDLPKYQFGFLEGLLSKLATS